MPRSTRLMQGKRNRMIVMKGRTVTDIDLADVAGKQTVGPVWTIRCYRPRRDLDTGFGD